MKANIEIIIGNNAIGKSYIIHQMADNDKGNIITNFDDDFYTEGNNYSRERIDILRSFLESHYGEGEVTIHAQSSGLYINIDGIKDFSRYFIDAVSLICRQGDRLYVDDIESNLRGRELQLFSSFVFRVANTFEHIVIVTHIPLFLGFDEDYSVYTVVTNGNEFELKQVADEDKYKIIN